MKSLRKTSSIILVFSMVTLLFISPANLSAHCDGQDGPVVVAAKKALEKENVNLVLIWIQKKDEAEVKRAFEHTLNVRKLGEEARKLADTFFFETLVRIHRAGEGAPFTGLKPAGRDLGPAIPAADNAIKKQSAKEVLNILNESVHNGLHHRFMNVSKLKDFSQNDVQAGRDYVKAYVEFVHYVEAIYNAATKEAGHAHVGSAAEHQH